MIELSTTDKRTFFLTLSPHEGQTLAQIAGFSPPSDDVAEIELTDVTTTWVALSASGCLDIAKEAADWMSDFLARRNDLTEDEALKYQVIFHGFSVALMGLLLDQELIALTAPSLPKESLTQFATILSQMMPLLYDDAESGYADDYDYEDDEEEEFDGE
jgi:hypothetical protein